MKYDEYDNLPGRNIPDGLLLVMAGERFSDAAEVGFSLNPLPAIKSAGSAVSSAASWTGRQASSAYNYARAGVAKIRGLADSPYVKYGAMGAAFVIPGAAAVVGAAVAANEIIKAAEKGGEQAKEAKKIISNTYRLAAGGSPAARRGLKALKDAKRIPWAKKTPAQRKATQAAVLKAIRANALRHRLSKMTPAQKKAWLLRGIMRARAAAAKKAKSARRPAGKAPRLGVSAARRRVTARRRAAAAKAKKAKAARAAKLKAALARRSSNQRAKIKAALRAKAKLRAAKLRAKAKERGRRAKVKEPKGLPPAAIRSATRGYFVTAGGKVRPGKFVKV